MPAKLHYRIPLNTLAAVLAPSRHKPTVGRGSPTNFGNYSATVLWLFINGSYI